MNYLKITVIGILLCTISFAFAEDAQSVIKKVDAVMNAAKDQKSTMKMILTDKNGNNKSREGITLQKGDTNRIIRFTSPADQVGIAFLELPDDVQYLYLPAFKKIRRIASHVKNTKFAGTDFTYDDLSAIYYGKIYDVKQLEENDKNITLELTPKSEENDYSKLVMTVLKENYYPAKIDYYDKGNNLARTLNRKKITKFNNYWFSLEIQMEDFKGNHKTQMIFENVEFDTNISDKLFSKRYLKRGK